jgi:hypothetical protein
MTPLEDFRKIVQGGDIPIIDNVTRSDLLAALGLVIECEECRGTGWIPDDPDGWDVPDMSMSGCPVCTSPGGLGGSGYQVAPELVELVYQTNPAAGRENAEQLLRRALEEK